MKYHSSFLPFITPMIYLKFVLSPVLPLFLRFAHGFVVKQNLIRVSDNHVVWLDFRKTVIVIFQNWPYLGKL